MDVVQRINEGYSRGESMRGIVVGSSEMCALQLRTGHKCKELSI